MRAIAIAVVLAATTRVAAAQQVQEEPCSAIEARVSDSVARGHGRALGDLVGCPAEGRRVLARLWRAGGGGVVGTVRNMSTGFRSDEVLSAIEDAAKNTGNSPEVRLYALQALVKYSAVSQELPQVKVAQFRPGDQLWDCVDCGSMGRTATDDPAWRQRAMLVFEALSHDGDPDVSRVATALLRAIAWLDPNSVPLSSGAITASFDCQRKEVRIQSRLAATIPGSIRQGIASDSIAARGGVTVALQGTWGQEDGLPFVPGLSRLTRRTRDPVQIFVGSRLVATASCSPAP